MNDMTVANLVLNAVELLSLASIVPLGLKWGKLLKKERDIRKEASDYKIDYVYSSIPQKKRFGSVEIRRIGGEKVRNGIFTFEKILNENPNFINFDSTIFYNNINSLKVESVDFSKNKEWDNFSGLYFVRLNKILLDIENDNYTNLFHELFHMSSSYKNNKIFNSGFCQSHFYDGKLYSYGEGINEGYTEYLVEKNIYNYMCDSTYVIEVFIASKIEQIIGKDVMMDLYSKADLKTFMLALGRYLSKDDVDKLITGTDFINKYYNKSNNTYTEADLINEKLNEIGIILVSAYKEKLLQEYFNKTKNRADVLIECSNFASSIMKFRYHSNGFVFKFSDNNSSNIYGEIVERDIRR